MQDDLKTEWQVISLPTKIDQALEKIAPQLMEWMGTLLLVFVIEVCSKIIPSPKFFLF